MYTETLKFSQAERVPLSGCLNNFKLLAQILLFFSLCLISQNAVLLDGDRVLLVLVGGIGAVPIILISSEAAQHEVAQVMFGDDP